MTSFISIQSPLIPVVARRLGQSGIIPTFRSSQGETVLLSDDLIGLDLTTVGSTGSLIEEEGLSVSIPHSRTKIYIDCAWKRPKAVSFAIIKNLIEFCRSTPDILDHLPHEVQLNINDVAKVLTASQSVYDYVKSQMGRAEMIESSRSSQFANSAYYMGSKRALCGFLVEAIAPYLTPSGIVVDIMCGSGAASGAFSQVWQTISSDSQEFCRALAVVQGGGMTVSEAESLLNQVFDVARNHARMLLNQLQPFVEQEEKIFNGNVGSDLLAEYRRFVNSLPTFPATPINQGYDWNPNIEVRKRQVDNTIEPYCLFTAYFANVYYGLRQCIEIDSVRFAIDQIVDERQRRWLLGSLVSTLSALGSTYAGHFAQPLLKNSEDLTNENLHVLIEKRTSSIYHDFAMRMKKLSEESARRGSPITIAPGPWQETVSYLKRSNIGAPILVYLDAPYRREEYSRYYHVLETAVTYTYPSSIGMGKIPDKQNGERFRSPFFTRNNERLSQAFCDIICAILREGWTCAWSYSDTADGDILEITSRIVNQVDCKVKSFSTPYEYKAQGGKRAKKVTEYLLLFIPAH